MSMEEDNEEEVEKFGIYKERRVAFWRCGGFVDFHFTFP